jgi:hypothetical protein
VRGGPADVRGWADGLRAERPGTDVRRSADERDELRRLRDRVRRGPHLHRRALRVRGIADAVRKDVHGHADRQQQLRRVQQRVRRRDDLSGRRVPLRDR